MRVNLPHFPNSANDHFLITSPQTTSYNCIAWAFGDDTRWYWPDIGNIYYWPEGIPREEKIEFFIQLFESIGYEQCDDGNLDAGYNKIAIYTDAFGKPTHAARQLESGLWTSKLGQNWDVGHTIFSMSDGYYGNVAVYMKRGNNIPLNVVLKFGKT